MKPQDSTKAAGAPRPGEAASLPHERDQQSGADATAGVLPGTRDVIEQAHDDIESGQEDTDMHDQRSIEKTQRKV